MIAKDPTQEQSITITMTKVFIFLIIFKKFNFKNDKKNSVTLATNNINWHEKIHKPL